MTTKKENKGTENQVQCIDISTLLKDAKHFRTLPPMEKKLAATAATFPEILILGDYLFHFVIWSEQLPEPFRDQCLDLANLHELYESLWEKF
ncbi:hypothetical protein [Lishizhenia sp.]|uniref:hypothetical protein n=1 Tax=Lishizhenia sp. TaxID=2497594 RepID=UPI00299E8717|nr:hypothetical protein [Lishizhenia sp.]MDX1447275.1 hypothetical protein [Lishizhenia sp.]